MRFFLPFIFCLIGATLSAQYEKGNWWLNAATGASWDSAPFDDSDLLSPNLQLGYLFSDRWLIGATISRPGFDELSMVTETRVTPFIRRYFPSLKNARLHYFAELGIGFSLSYEGAMPQAAVGLEYQLSPGIMLSGSVSGGTNVGASNFSPVPSAIGIRLGTNVLFGGINEFQRKGDYALQKGDLLLDGSLGSLAFGWRRGNNNVLSGNFRFSAGYMLSDQVMLEGAANSDVSDFIGTDESTFDAQSNSGSVSLGVRYQLSSGKRLQPYLGGGARYDFLNYELLWNDAIVGREDFGVDTDGFGPYAKGGFLYFLRDNVALDANLGYRSSLTADDQAQVNGQLFGGIGLKLFLKNKRKKTTVGR